MGKVYGPVKKGSIYSFQEVGEVGELALTYTRTMLPPKKFSPATSTGSRYSTKFTFFSFESFALHGGEEVRDEGLRHLKKFEEKHAKAFQKELPQEGPADMLDLAYNSPV